MTLVIYGLDIFGFALILIVDQKTRKMQIIMKKQTNLIEAWNVGFIIISGS